MGGESGTSHMGNIYYYYKCGNAKRHGKAHCDLKAIRKEPLERFVVDTAIKVIFSDEIIEQLIDLVMEAQQKENTWLPVLKDQLRDTEKRLANLLEAIEQGIDVYKRQVYETPSPRNGHIKQDASFGSLQFCQISGLVGKI